MSQTPSSPLPGVQRATFLARYDALSDPSLSDPAFLLTLFEAHDVGKLAPLDFYKAVYRILYATGTKHLLPRFRRLIRDGGPVAATGSSWSRQQQKHVNDRMLKRVEEQIEAQVEAEDAQRRAARKRKRPRNGFLATPLRLKRPMFPSASSSSPARSAKEGGQEVVAYAPSAAADKDDDGAKSSTAPRNGKRVLRPDPTPLPPRLLPPGRRTARTTTTTVTTTRGARRGPGPSPLKMQMSSADIPDADAAAAIDSPMMTATVHRPVTGRVSASSSSSLVLKLKLKPTNFP